MNPEYLYTGLNFVLILGVLIFIHELGHFLSAKFFGVKVEEFGFGLPPKIWGKKKGETEYTVNALPIGGFVRLTGEDSEEPSKDPRNFISQAPWKRAVMVTAGVLMNFILAVAVLTVVYVIGGPLPTDKVLIGKVAKDSPALSSGLKEGDVITAINGVELGGPEDLRDKTDKLAGSEIAVSVEREGRLEVLKVTPRENPPQGQGSMGIEIYPYVATKSFPIWEAPVVGFNQALRATGLMVDSLRTMLRDLFVEKEVPEEVGGLGRIAYFTHLATKSGFVNVLMLLGLLSLNLAIINILPLPALDGGRLLFITAELITRRKVPLKLEKWVHTFGMVFLLFLIILITYQDIIWLWLNTSLGEKVTQLIPFK
jgi:regulator of sigma E protease